jgi:hypothetical protein
MITIELEGVEEVIAALEQWEKEVIEILAKAIDESGEHLLTTAKGLAPKLTGDLEGSGTKDPVVIDDVNREVSVEVGFHKVYAARRHEEIYKPGPITRGKPTVDGMRPGRKYLEKPLLKYRKKYPQEWAKAIRDVTGTG